MAVCERRFSDSEKKDIAVIICNEEMVSADGLEEEAIVVKLQSKATSYKQGQSRLAERRL